MTNDGVLLECCILKGGERGFRGGEGIEFPVAFAVALVTKDEDLSEEKL